MALQLNAESITQRIRTCKGFRTAGRLLSVQGVIKAQLRASVGELCMIFRKGSPVLSSDEAVLTEVIGFDDECCQIMPLENTDGLSAGQLVVGLGRGLKVPTGLGMLGRVVDAIGAPIDERGPVVGEQWIPVTLRAPNPMTRPPICRPFETGQKAIDGLLTMGKGQRVGLFSGSGVGKSTLLGQIARKSDADINVVALIGERGREIRPFIEDCLGADGLSRSVVIVSSAEQPALIRVRAAQTATAIADWFRRQGAEVMFMLDSMTRLVTAQRELGLLLNEPPTARGYPPSAFQLMSNLVELLGESQHGSITGLITVLVDGDDVTEPVADAARSVLDGHIVLSRDLAQQSHFPAIDVAASISRLANELTDDQHREDARKLRQILQTYHEIEDLLRIGSYQPGTSGKVDRAIQLKPQVDEFLRQDINVAVSLDETRSRMQQIASQWTMN